MPYDSLADFLEELDAAGELVAWRPKSTATWKIAEITRRVAAESRPGPAVRKRSRAVAGRGHQSAGHRGPRLPGVGHRVARRNFGRATESLIEKHTPHNWFDRLKISADEAGANKFRPKSRQERPLPAGRAAGARRRSGHAARRSPMAAETPPGDHRRAVDHRTPPATKPARPRSARCKCSTPTAWRSSTMATRTSPATGCRRYRGPRKRCPSSRCLGGDPAGIDGRESRARRPVDFFHSLGLLRGKPLEVVKCRTHSMEVPAKADMVLEGYLDPGAPWSSGRSGRHRRQLLSTAGNGGGAVNVTAITHRTHPIFPAIDRLRPAGRDRGRAGGGPRADAAAGGSHGGPRRRRHASAGLRRFAPLGVGLAIETLSVPRPANRQRPVGFGGPAIHQIPGAGRQPRRRARRAARCWPKSAPTWPPSGDIFSYDGPAHGSDHANPARQLGRRLAHRRHGQDRRRTDRQPGPLPLAAGEEISQLVTDRWSRVQAGDGPGGRSRGCPG